MGAPAVQPDLDALVGLLCWRCLPGVGTCFTAELGAPILKSRERCSPRSCARYGSPHRCVDLEGSVRLWAYCCDWTLLREGAPIGSGGDPHEVMTDRLGALQGSRVRSLSYSAPAWSLELDSGFVAEMTQSCTTESDAVAYVTLGATRWLSLMPDGRVLDESPDTPPGGP